jgi:hydrogenase expression/formation protein HypC
MCLAIPGKVLQLKPHEEAYLCCADVQFGGITREVNTSLVPEVQVGDYVLVHVGVAISIVDEVTAAATLEWMQETDPSAITGEP